MKRGCIVRHGQYPACVRVRKESFALVEKGYELDVICLKPKDSKKWENINGINVYRISGNRHRGGIFRYLYEYLSFFCVATLKICSLHFRKKYDFIQVNTLPDFLVFVAFLPKLLGSRVVLDMHEPAPELFKTQFGIRRNAIIRLVIFFEQISMRFADSVITVTEQMKHNYIRRGATPNKIKVVLNVPNLEFNSDLYKKKLKPNKSKFLLICHGAMLKRYGQHVAIKAIDIVKEKIPNVQLNILGYGNYEYDLKKLVSNLKLETYICFHGFLPFSEMIKMISNNRSAATVASPAEKGTLLFFNKIAGLATSPILAGRIQLSMNPIIKG